MTQTQTIATKNQRARDIENKKYYCADCERTFRDKTTLKAHMNSMKHNPDRYAKYTCGICNYTTKFKGSLNTHNKTKKHMNAVCSVVV